MNPPEWNLDPERFIRRVRANEAVSAKPRSTDSDRRRQLAACGVFWTAAAIDFERIRPSELDRSRLRFRALLPELVWNAAALEGNAFTLPEVRTLLDNVTVGGRKTEDQAQILALSDGYSTLDALTGSREFELSKPVSDRLHGLVARHEAIEAGHFRGEGAASGGGDVHLANGGQVAGSPHGQHGSTLIDDHGRLLDHLTGLTDARERALVYFAAATRRQCYFDGNKRTARLMMSGELMSNGFDAVSVPYARRLEYNTALDELLTTDDATELMQFVTSCTIR